AHPVARPLPAAALARSHAAQRRPRQPRAGPGARTDHAGHTRTDPHGLVPGLGREQEATMRRIFSSTPAKVVALLAGIALVIGAVWLFTTQTQTYTAYFDSTRGLYDDDTVRVIGRQVC